MGVQPKPKENPMTTPTKPKTLAPLFDAYIAHLKAIGKSESTAKSYAGDLALAKKHFGDDLALSKMTKKAVEDFFASDAVNLTRKGTPKSKITTDKIKRVLRLALIWAEAEGHMKKAPLPATAKKEAATPKKSAADKKEPKPATKAKPPVLKKPRKKAEPKATKATKESK